MPQAISVVTLLTDFGDRDYFVASMKGVILGVNPQARIVDLSHQVTPHNIEEAAYLLKSAYHYFPEGTVHVAVVDPGVGTTRRPLLATSSRYHFLAPDNGLLTHVLNDEVGVEVRQIENKQYRLDSEGATFDGRDLFAPCAGWLTRGQQPGSYGRLVQDYVKLPLSQPEIRGGVLRGRIMYIDRFGNVISNLTRYHLREIAGVTKTSVEDLRIRLGMITTTGLAANYQGGETDVPHALINSNGQIEVFLKEGSAAKALNVTVGDAIEVS
jgi:S-adenosylmethionine hydrolase